MSSGNYSFAATDMRWMVWLCHFCAHRDPINRVFQTYYEGHNIALRLIVCPDIVIR